MWRVIKQGNHDSFSFSELGLHFGKTKESYEVIFDESCRYDFKNINNLDWNKGSGWSYGLHHKNSIRWSWRYNKEEDNIQVSLYNYIDGILQVREDCIKLELGKKYYIDLINSETLQQSFLIVTSLDKPKMLLRGDYISPKWGYNLGLYFGGQETPEKDIRIFIKKI